MDNRLHILIVDDDNRIRDLLKDFLSQNNYIVSTSENAENAKEKLKYFIEQLINMRSYDDMLDEMIMSTRIQDMSERERGNDGLTLNEILNSLDIRKWKDSDEKN